MNCPIAERAKSRYADDPCIRTARQTLSYAQVDARIQTACVWLEYNKLNKKNRVLHLCHNSINDICFYFACLRLGIVDVLVNSKLPKERIQSIAEEAKVDLIVDPGRDILLKRQKIELKNTFDQNKPANMMCTSGTTDAPKIVVHSAANHYYSALGSNKIIPLKRAHIWAWNLPIYHVSGLSILWRTFIAGASITIPAKNVLPKAATHISLVPVQLKRLLANSKKKRQLKKYTRILLGGSPVDPALIQRGLPIYTTYGLTEASSQVVTNNKILPHVRMRVTKKGDVEICGKVLFLGYFRKGRLIRQKGWFKTGDSGRWEGKKFIVTGRKDNMFISGGENIYPEEIERALRKVNGIEKALVVSKDNKTYGQVPVAYVQISKKISPQQITKALEKDLPRFKIPKKYYQWPTPDDLRRIAPRLSRVEAKAAKLSL